MKRKQINIYKQAHVTTTDMLHDFTLVFNRTLSFKHYQQAEGILDVYNYNRLAGY